jgi:DNA-binding transcriptional ArsR family regulator
VVSVDRCGLLSIDLARAEGIRRRLDAQRIDRPVQAARALGDPTRLTLALALLKGGELCVCDLAWIAGKAENLVGHHLRALRAAGLAHSRREHRMVFYALTDRGGLLLDALANDLIVLA